VSAEQLQEKAQVKFWFYLGKRAFTSVIVTFTKFFLLQYLHW